MYKFSLCVERCRGGHRALAVCQRARHFFSSAAGTARPSTRLRIARGSVKLKDACSGAAGEAENSPENQSHVEGLLNHLALCQGLHARQALAFVRRHVRPEGNDVTYDAMGNLRTVHCSATLLGPISGTAPAPIGAGPAAALTLTFDWRRGGSASLHYRLSLPSARVPITGRVFRSGGSAPKFSLRPAQLDLLRAVLFDESWPPYDTLRLIYAAVRVPYGEPVDTVRLTSSLPALCDADASWLERYSRALCGHAAGDAVSRGGGHRRAGSGALSWQVRVAAEVGDTPPGNEAPALAPATGGGGTEDVVWQLLQAQQALQRKLAYARGGECGEAEGAEREVAGQRMLQLMSLHQSPHTAWPRAVFRGTV